MSGKTGSPQDSINLVEKQLDEFLNNLNLKTALYDPGVEDVLNYSAEQLRSLSAEECGITSYMLQQYTLYLQKQVNRFKNIADWANNNIKIVVAKTRDQYGDKFTKWDERIYMVKAGDTYAQALNSIERKASMYKQELDMIITRVNSLANTLLELNKTKRYIK